MNEIDNLMTRIRDIMLKGADELLPQDIDDVIAYQRKMRAAFDAGVKPKKAQASIADIGQKLLDLGFKKKVEVIKRRRID